MHKDSLLVSVCMITYNQDKYISRAIEGVLLQKGNFQIELNIGEDLSTDSTRKICEEYFKNYSQISLLPTTGKLGMMNNFIRTLNSCSGKYIALCEGDDYWIDPFKLQKQVDFLEGNPKYSLVHSNYNILNSKAELLPQFTIPKESYNLDYLLQYNCIRTVTCLFRREDWMLDGFSESLPYGDWPLFLNIARNKLIKYLPEVTAIYRTNVGVTTTDSFKKPIHNRIKVIDWFLKNNPKYRIACNYSKGLQYKELILKSTSKSTDLFENYQNFLTCFFKTLFFQNRYFKLNFFKTTAIFFKRKSIDQIMKR